MHSKAWPRSNAQPCSKGAPPCACIFESRGSQCWHSIMHLQLCMTYTSTAEGMPAHSHFLKNMTMPEAAAFYQP